MKQRVQYSPSFSSFFNPHKLLREINVSVAAQCATMFTSYSLCAYLLFAVGFIGTLSTEHQVPATAAAAAGNDQDESCGTEPKQ